jgi:hypothetical protein
VVLPTRPPTLDSELETGAQGAKTTQNPSEVDGSRGARATSASKAAGVQMAMSTAYVHRPSSLGLLKTEVVLTPGQGTVSGLAPVIRTLSTLLLKKPFLLLTPAPCLIHQLELEMGSVKARVSSLA